MIPIDDAVENRKALEEGRPIWHLPLMCVNEPTKIRICHDAKASCGGVCLNDLLLGGPNFINSLVCVLILFCHFKYVFTTDIAAFFHEILLDKRDLDVFRYLWFTDQDMREDCVKRFLSHIFGSASSSCITSFVVRFLAQMLKERFPPNVIEAILCG